ncbi:3-methyl-2-oxobutanoate dehydrogenase subunit VorB [bacterium]|nr:3-methyl-2-oxobutanoate dehydrogenase subunit VorB [bacterium]
MKSRPKPYVFPEYCKGCGRCIDSCPKGCITMGKEVNPLTGLIPIELELDQCSGCGLCISACPEPYGLRPQETEFEFELTDPKSFNGPRPTPKVKPFAIPGEVIPFAQTESLVTKGTYASAIGALLAGCRHFFGYPITPSTEGAELMAKLLPDLDGVFIQAVSEVATVNMMYGCSGAGLPCMTFTSSPGFSLMLEGISYSIGAELPGVFVNIMRGGPGLGNLGPEQADIKLVCRGLGHGNTHAIVLAPYTPQEMLDLTMLAFELTFKYRNPVIIVGDGYMGQMTGRVNLPKTMIKPGIPEWAVYGDEMHRGNLVCSIELSEADLEKNNIRINNKYRQMTQNEQRADLYHCDDAEIILMACNTPARMAKGAVNELRKQGLKVGLFRPITLWPFPIDLLKPVLSHTKQIITVEAGNGQLEDELRLSLSHHSLECPTIDHVRRFGGILPQLKEIIEKVISVEEVLA